jgi:hypothetical protein
MHRRRHRVLLALLTGAHNLTPATLCRVAEAKPGSLYPLLTQLERHGLVDSWREEGDDGLIRRCYGLTEQGRTWAYQQLGLKPAPPPLVHTHNAAGEPVFFLAHGDAYAAACVPLSHLLQRAEMLLTMADHDARLNGADGHG